MGKIPLVVMRGGQGYGGSPESKKRNLNQNQQTNEKQDHQRNETT